MSPDTQIIKDNIADSLSDQIPVETTNRTDDSEHRPLREARAEFERQFILKRLRENDWNISKTADDLKIERTHLHRKIKLLGIQENSRD
jgi:two-component system nitrogen regulation response regulator NtrX